MNKHFIPVKITDKKWADKLVNGEVYMRALHEFGSWGNVNEKDTVLDNDYRGDFFAGVTANYRTPDDSEFFRGFPAEVKAYMRNCCLVDESDVQFFKIFSLYRHELDEEKQEFVAPDPRIAQFGNTAVLITDFCEFIERYGDVGHVLKDGGFSVSTSHNFLADTAIRYGVITTVLELYIILKAAVISISKKNSTFICLLLISLLVNTNTILYSIGGVGFPSIMLTLSIGYALYGDKHEEAQA